MNNIKVSISVPVYKAERVISRCIDSIISQTFSEWELLLVNDGTPDSSGNICEQYAKIDKRINVIHKSNGGVSSARNTGLTHACGDYIAFIDADDYVYPNYIEQLVSHTPSDLVICGFENMGSIPFSPKTESILFQNNSNALKKLVDVPYYLDAPWGKLFNHRIIQDNGLLFDSGLRLSEDTLFCYEYIRCCKKVTIISSPLYVYDGVWGGDSKYQLSYDELNYASQRVVAALDCLNRTFDLDIDTRYKCFHLAKLKGLFSDYTDKQTYELYLQSHKEISFEEYMADSRLSPLTIGLLLAIELNRSGHDKECKQHLINLKHFLTLSIKKYPTTKQKVFYTLLLYGGANYTLFVMKFFSKFI